MVVPTAAGPPYLGVKDLTLGTALKWQNPLSETLCARAHRPTHFHCV